jgi:hypothetical protein
MSNKISFWVDAIREIILKDFHLNKTVYN